MSDEVKVETAKVEDKKVQEGTRKRPRCSKCGRRIRGKDHENGQHHRGTAKK